MPPFANWARPAVLLRSLRRSAPVKVPTRCHPAATASIPRTMATASSWVGSAGAGGVDLRSDVTTTPTASMLAAVASASLLDDVYREDPTTRALEAHCATLTGKEAGLLALSGTMGNQLALRALLQQSPAAVLCDHRAHIFCYEAGGVSALTGAMVQPVVPRNGRYLTVEDVAAHAVLGDDVHGCPTRVVSLENTLNGVVQPLAEMQRISAWARSHGILVHCDGARLWEAAAAVATAPPDAFPDATAALAAFAACCDTLSLCCSKGLGAPIGSVVVGPADVVRRATWARKAIGGGLRQAGVVAAAARVAVDETFLGGKLPPTHALAREIAQLWTDAGGRLEYPVDTNMVWLDLSAASADVLTAAAAEEGLRISGTRLVLHYQVYERRADVVPALGRVFAKVLAHARAHAGQGPSTKGTAYPTA